MTSNPTQSSHADEDQELIASLLLAARIMNRQDLQMLVRFAVLLAKQSKPRWWLTTADRSGRFLTI